MPESELAPKPHDKQQIRRAKRAARLRLSRAEQQLAARRMMRRMHRLDEFKRSRRIAIYLPNDGEIDPRVLLSGRDCERVRWYLPIITTQKVLRFAPYRPGMPLRPNRYGIPEPARQRHDRAAQALDLICMPLVAFSANGSRLGMGGGFYDRSLAFKRRKQIGRPLLIGLAHHCQREDSLSPDEWDIPLDIIVTDREIIRP